MLTATFMNYKKGFVKSEIGIEKSPLVLQAIEDQLSY